MTEEEIGTSVPFTITTKQIIHGKKMNQACKEFL